MEEEWYGLACPPMEDYAYNFDQVNAYNLDPNVFFRELCEEQQDCNEKKMVKEPTIVKKHGKGKELKKVFEVMKPHMEVDSYEEAVNHAMAQIEMEMEKEKDKEKDNELKLEVSKRKLRESYGRFNDFKKQRTVKHIEFQPPVPMLKPTIQRTKSIVQEPTPKNQKPMPIIKKSVPTVHKPKPQTRPRLRTTWASRVAKTAAEICS